ncbi:hypothetical protein [Flexithrix dorotheae]|uniref:hypothetical protein n=1 Tax=Flexithrix dorotheae TaxID=70993 RepID=UPI00036798F5|nr:hypothetical protein [Flexithrix dorotheae]
MKLNYVASILIGLFLFAITSAFTTSEINKETDILGTWSFDAPYAPYEYSKGKMIFEKKDGKLTGTVKMDYYNIEVLDLKKDNNKVTFGINVENEYVSMELEFNGNEFKGKANYSEGTLDLSGKKEN